MNILALETSSQWCSVAVWLDGRIIASEVFAGQKHSELLLPMVNTVLMQASVPLRAMDAVAFGAGPGSFTGLRIACGVAQGLAAGTGIATVGVGTLLAMAQASGASRVIAALDARMGEIYYAAYERAADTWNVVHAPCLCTPEQAPRLSGQDWTGVGSGFAAHAEALASHYENQLTQIRSEIHPHAQEVALLGADLAARGMSVPPQQAHPLYLRDHVALTIEERRAGSRADSTGEAR